MLFSPAQIAELPEDEVFFTWNGRDYRYKGWLVSVEEVGGLMRQRVLAHKRWARGGKAFSGVLVGALRTPNGEMIYLVFHDQLKKIIQSAKIQTID